MPSLGPMELILILAIVILLFGAGKIPEIGGAVGKSIKEFRSSMREANEDATEGSVKQVAEASTEKK
jgi:sec-independent protein translocase protein TatA